MYTISAWYFENDEKDFSFAGQSDDLETAKRLAEEFLAENKWVYSIDISRGRQLWEKKSGREWEEKVQIW